MSSTSLPSYVGDIPPYSAYPQPFEQRLALNQLRFRPSGNFIKQSGGISLRLIEQDNNVDIPVYGCGDSVEGTVNISKPESITSVEVKVRLDHSELFPLLPFSFFLRFRAAFV